MIAGYNENEAASLTLTYTLGPFLAKINQSLSDGISLQVATDYLRYVCSNSYTVEAAELCTVHLVNLYGLSRVTDNKIRLLQVIKQISESYVIISRSNYFW